MSIILNDPQTSSKQTIQTLIEENRSLANNQSYLLNLIEQLLSSQSHFKKPIISSSNLFKIILDCKVIDPIKIVTAIVNLCSLSTSIEELFTSKFYVALEHGFISLTTFKQDTNNVDNQKLFGIDFVNHEHPSHINLKSILLKNSFEDKFIKNYCNFLNRLVLHIIIFQDKVKELTLYSKLSKENQEQIRKLKQQLVVPQSILTLYSSLSFSTSTTDELIELLTFLLVDIKIDIDYCHFEYVIEKKSIEELELLIRHATNLNIQGGEYSNTALIFTAKNGHLDCLNLLIENKTNLESQDNDGWTALMYAAHNGHLDCLKLLIENKANLELKNKIGLTALMYAAHNGHLDCLNLLIENKANLESQDNDGWTALMYAAHRGKIDCVLKLIQSGSKLGLRNYKGRTALGIAKQNGHEECIKLLSI